MASPRLSDMELMKEKFAKLLLGEDMSGGGKGVSPALALSNAVTNIAASAFGQQKRLEPMSPETKARWKREIDWLLSVTDHIVEFVATKQTSKEGVTMEIMSTRQRTDLRMNIPALRKLDYMLLECLDNFKDQKEFHYSSSKDSKESKNHEKWWIPIPKVVGKGLSEGTRKWLQFQRDSVNQILKAAMAINTQVLSEMQIPENYIDSLPKNGKASLGEAIYKSITDDFFDPDSVLSSLDLSTEHKILDLKNRIEASIVIWKRKMIAKDTKSSWGPTIKIEKRELFEERAETFLMVLKHRFPGLPQSELDVTKIQYNKDVGYAILESYSRIIESLAFTVLSRMEEVLKADTVARNNEQKKAREKLGEPRSLNLRGETPASKTLFDFMGWDQEMLLGKDEINAKPLSKPEPIITNKRISYIEKLHNLGGARSPTERH